MVIKKCIQNNLQLLGYIIKHCPSLAATSMITSVLASVDSIISILFMRYIIDSITGRSSIVKPLIVCIGMLLLSIALTQINAYLQNVSIPRGTVLLRKHMQNRIIQKALEMDILCYEDAEFYNKYTTATQQSDARALAVLQTFASFIGSLLSIGSLIVLIGSIQPVLLAIAIVSVTVSIILNAKGVTYQHALYQKNIPHIRKSIYAQYAFYQNTYAKDFKLYPQLHEILKNIFNHAISGQLELIYDYGKKLMRITASQGIFGQIMNTISILYLVYQAIMRSISIGDFTLLYSGLQQLTGQLMQFFSVFPQLYEHGIYIDNFNEFLNHISPIENTHGNISFPSAPAIVIKNVSFIYPNSTKTALQKVSMEIGYREKIALVGLNGSGKSTLVKLLTRLYDPTEGAIYANRRHYGDYDLFSLRNSMGIVFQDFHLFNISIAENILMRPIIHQETDRQHVESALRAVGLYEKVCSLPQGIFTVFNKEFDNTGAVFSTGEIQKLVIARLFVKKCGIIILDEPSSALDPFAEKHMFNTMLEVAQDKTIILISHSLANVQRVDRIYYFEDGCLLESGTHSKLMEKNKLYASMYRTQAENYIG